MRQANLVHGVGEKGGERSSLADGLLLVAMQQLVEVGLLLVLGQDLQTVVMIAHVLLVDAEHRQQHVEQICNYVRHQAKNLLPHCRREITVYFTVISWRQNCV